MSEHDYDSEGGRVDHHVDSYPDYDQLRIFTQMMDEVPTDHRLELANFAAELSKRSPPFAAHSGMRPICDGHCRSRQGELGAMAYIYNVADEDEQQLLDTQISDTVTVLTYEQARSYEEESVFKAAAAQGLLERPGESMQLPAGSTLADSIIRTVSEREHRAHMVGHSMNRKAGMASARLLFCKILLVVQALSCLTEVEGTTYGEAQSGAWRNTTTSELADAPISWDFGINDWIFKKTVNYNITTRSCTFYRGTCDPERPNLSDYQLVTCTYHKGKCQVDSYALVVRELCATLFDKAREILMVAFGIVFAMLVVAFSAMLQIAFTWVALYFAIGVFIHTELTSKTVLPHIEGALVIHGEEWPYIYIITTILQFFIGLTTCVAIRYSAFRVRDVVVLTAKSGSAYLNRVRRMRVARSGKLDPSSGSISEAPRNLVSLVSRSLLQPEMSQSGSEFAETKANKALLSICAQDYAGTFSHVGFAFRHRDYLITAYHVVDGLLNQNVTTFLAPIVDKSGKSVVDMSRMVEWQPDYSNNIVPSDSEDGTNPSTDYDCFIQKMPPNYFSKLGMSSLKTAYAAWNTPVRAYGYFKPNVKSAMGLITKSGEDGFLYYTASTRDGSSGCPIVSGGNFYALHLGVASSGENRGLSAAVIELFLDRYENLKPESEAYPNAYRHKVTGKYYDKNGNECFIRKYPFGYSLVDSRSGRERPLRQEQIDAIREIDELIDIGRGRIMESAKIEAALPELTVVFDDEPKTATTPQAFSRPSTPHAKLKQLIQGTVLSISEQHREPVHTPAFDGYDRKTEEVLQLDTAAEIGYDADKFGFPAYKNMRQAVADSLTKHVEVFVDASKNCVVPTEEVQNQAYRLAMQQLKHLAYFLPKDPLSAESILAVWNSSLIGNNKSPGRSFMVDGLMSNAAVRARYTDEEIVAMVQKKEPPQDVNVFGKMDPHKKSKLDSGMMRCISGCDVRETIRAQVYFSELNSAMAKNWRNSPIKVGFSPLQPGSGAHFYKKLNGDASKFKWMEDDTSTWDWRYMEYLARLTSKVAVGLGKRAKGMSEDDAIRIRQEAYDMAIRQFSFPLVLPDGTAIDRLKPNIMTSGSVLTLAFNSIATLLMDNMSKLQMGYTMDQILTQFVVCVGGDDKLQRVPKDFDQKAYIANLNQMGSEIHEAKIHDTVDGVEFFSWKFMRSDDTAREIVWLPTRFTKHVHALRATKYADLKDALVSHALNWVHDKTKFDYFRSIFERCSETDNTFDLKRFPDRQDTINYLSGFESAYAFKDLLQKAVDL